MTRASLGGAAHLKSEKMKFRVSFSRLFLTSEFEENQGLVDCFKIFMQRVERPLYIKLVCALV